MKNNYFIGVTFFLICLLFSCGGNHQNHNINSKTASPKISKSILSSDIDPICNMKLQEDGIADTTLYEGKVIGFCAPGCKVEFLRNPTAYTKK